MSEITQAMLMGQYQDADGVDLNPIKDAEMLYTQEIALAERPSVMKRIGATALGTVSMALYLGSGEPNRQIVYKAIYALFAAGLGINVGIAAQSTRVDSVAAAALYYGFTKASSRLNVTGQDSSLTYEALGALAAGMAYDYYVRSTILKTSE